MRATIMCNRFFTIAVAGMLALLLSDCSTPATRLDAQWVDPAVAGKRPIRSVMVTAVARDATNRRIFEDQMVAALDASGVKAVQSYRFITGDAPATEAQLRNAVAEAGVTQVLATRIINVSTQVDVTPGMVMGPAWGPGWGWPGPGWGPGWGGFQGYYNTAWAIPPQVTTTQNVHADTRVFDVGSGQVLWSGATTTSIRSESIPQLIDQFVQLIVATLKKDGMI